MDVVLIELAKGDLEDSAGEAAGVSQPVCGALRHPDTLALCGAPGSVRDRDVQRPVQHLPQLAAVVVPLQREALPWPDGDDLDGHVLVADELLERSPRPFDDERIDGALTPRCHHATRAAWGDAWEPLAHQRVRAGEERLANRPFANSIAKMVLASGVMAVVVWLSSVGLERVLANPRVYIVAKLTAVLVPIGLGAAVYFELASRLGLEEAAETKQLIARRLSRRKPNG